MPESPTQWQAAFALLEELIALDEPARERRLRDIEAHEPSLAHRLRQLIEANAAARAEGFLDPQTAQKTPLTTAADLAVGQHIGPFELMAPLGRGGMGEVWRATRTDGLYEKPIALKLLHLHLAGTAMRTRFLREGRILGQFTHPHIAQLLDAGVSESGQPYLALEFVDGERFDRWCEQRRLSTRLRLQLFLQVCAAVRHAHAHLVVHRDLKPSNVLVTAEGQVKLLDFGIAKLVEEQSAAAAETELTRVGGRVLTPEYAAPEQITGAPVTVATDVYALGVMLYRLLTGARPYGEDAQTPAQLERAVLEVDPPPPSRVVGRLGEPTAAERSTTPGRLRAELSGDLDTVALKALKKAPQERYSSVDALAEDIRRYLHHEPLLAQPDTWSYRARKYVRRHRGGVAAAAAISLALIAGVAGTLWQAREALRQEQIASRRADELATVVQFQGELLRRVDMSKLGPAIFTQMQARLRANLQRLRRPEEEQAATVARFAEFEPLADAIEATRLALELHLLQPAQGQIAQLAQTPQTEIALRRSLADAYIALGLPQAALQQIEQAVVAYAAIAAELEPARARRTDADLRYARAQALGELDRIDDFRAASEGLVDAFDAAYGPDHISTLRARRLVVKTLIDTGELDEARRWTEDLIARQTALLGADHAETLESRGSLQSILYRLDDPRQIEMSQSFLRDAERALGPDHPHTQRAYLEAGNALFSQGRWAEAADHYRKAYESLKRTHGGDHWQTLKLLSSLGTALNADNRPEEGEPYLAEAWVGLRAHLGEDHTATQVAGNNYAYLLRHSGRAAQAVPIMESIVRMRRVVLGEEHPRTLFARNNLAVTLAAAGRGDESLAIHDEVIAIQTRVLGPMHYDTSTGRILRCDTLAAIGRGADASREFESLIADIEAHFGRDSDRFRSTVEEYVGHLKGRGLRQEAEAAAERYDATWIAR